MKKLLVFVSHTSKFNGPIKPWDPHYLIKEIDSYLLSEKPVLQLTNIIFGSSAPQTFDLTKLFTDSG